VISDLGLAVHASGMVIVEQLEVADGFWSRMAGLQFRRSLPTGAGLLIVPCSAVHTCWMRFAIDLVGIDRFGNVIAVKKHVKPWRIAVLPRGVYAILELPPGTAHQIHAGDELCLLRSDGRASLRFLHNESQLCEL
jgi:uncharacterized membrane protein (UPF0127 family)